NYNTFTTAIYRAWSGMFSTQAALELAAILMLFVLLAVLLERRSRAGARFVARDAACGGRRIQLRGAARWMAAGGAAMVFTAACAAPVLQLLLWAAKHASSDIDARYWGYAARSMLLAGSAALVIVGASVMLAYALRREGHWISRVLVRIATMGYAVPGTVLAVGILVPLIALNNAVHDAARALFGTSAGIPLLQGTLLGVLLAYMARFLAVGFSPVESGLQRITRSVDEAAASLGVVGSALVRRVHAPLLRTSLATAALLVFVDVMKE